MTSYRIEIDRSICSGFGACEELAPHFFEVAPDGIATLRAAVTDDPGVLDAADACPMGAITVVEVVEEAA
jgi:ferredoxin